MRLCWKSGTHSTRPGLVTPIASSEPLARICRQTLGRTR